MGTVISPLVLGGDVDLGRDHFVVIQLLKISAVGVLLLVLEVFARFLGTKAGDLLGAAGLGDLVLAPQSRKNMGELDVLGVERSLSGGDFQFILHQLPHCPFDLSPGGILETNDIHLLGIAAENIDVLAKNLVGVNRSAVDHDNHATQDHVLIRRDGWFGRRRGEGDARRSCRRRSWGQRTEITRSGFAK